ncbi:ester cyclase [Fulvivirgaceae bacterium BMA10]|uniref:Ester cyclase n=1 Tax=Splendidivirga corallicola TaxID=3051826 RepID=A0ABT8KUS1_9BACT|nr:ester cyclase [Fulvivirgaceae bacterium BMA10]
MVEVIKQYVLIWNEKSISDLKNVFQANARYWDALQEGNAIELLENSISTTHIAFPDVSFEIISLNYASENKIFMEWLMMGTNNGTFFGAAPTGKRIEIKGLDYFVCENGKISEIKSFYDSSLFHHQLEI